jgi:hypothetical protein
MRVLVLVYAAFDVAGHADVENMRAAGHDVCVVAAILHEEEDNERMECCPDAEGNGTG